MTKSQFLTAVRERLAGLPQSDINRFLDFYAEMIDDRMEDGLTEAEAVSAMGTPEYVASQILMDPSLSRPAQPQSQPSSGWKGWQILLLVLGSPVWLPLLLAGCMIAFSLFISVWAVLIALFASVVAMGLVGVGCAIGGFFGVLFTGLSGPMLALCGSGLLLNGLSILLFMALIQLTRGINRFFRWLKSLFHHKEATT